MRRIITLAALALAGCSGAGPEPAIISSQSIPASMQGVEAKRLFGAQDFGSEAPAFGDDVFNRKRLNGKTQ